MAISGQNLFRGARRTLLLLCAAVVAAGCATPPQQPPRLISFGDSLTDLGTYASALAGHAAA